MAFIESGQKFDKEKHRAKMAKLMENMDRVCCTIRIPTHIHTKMKLKLAKQRKNMNDVILDMLLKYIDKE